MSKYLVKGTEIFNGVIPRYEPANWIRIRKYSQTVLIGGNSNASVTLGALNTPSGYTFVGVIPYSNGYGDQWTVTYALYGQNIVAKVKSWYGGDLTSQISCYAVYIKTDIYNSINL